MSLMSLMHVRNVHDHPNPVRSTILPEFLPPNPVKLPAFCYADSRKTRKAILFSNDGETTDWTTASISG